MHTHNRTLRHSPTVRLRPTYPWRAAYVSGFVEILMGKGRFTSKLAKEAN